MADLKVLHPGDLEIIEERCGFGIYSRVQAELDARSQVTEPTEVAKMLDCPGDGECDWDCPVHGFTK